MKLWYKPNFITICAILILSIPALFSLSRPGFYTSHDGETHTARIAQYYVALKDDQFPPRFAGSFYNGLGSPIFVYIYPLPYLLGALLHFLGFSFVNAFKILMVSGFIFSGIFTYIFLKELTKSTKAAFVGSIYYIWSPYHLSLIYVRGSLSEHLAYTFLPLVFFAFTKLANTKRTIWIPMTAIFVSFLLLSQNLVALISAPVVVIYILILSFKTKSIKSLVYSILAGVWGLTISAFVYLPSVLEIKFIKFKQVISPVFADHFVYIKQLIYSPWGYGFDMPGFSNDQLSLQIGLAHLLILFLFTFLLIYFFIEKVLKMKRTFILNKLNKNDLILMIFFITVIAIGTFLMIEDSITNYIWIQFKLGKFIDIPWRLTGLVIFSISIICAYLVKIGRPAILMFILIVFVIIANRNHLRINETVQHDDNFFLNYTGTATQYNEFTPNWRQTTRVPIGFDLNQKTTVVNGLANINTIINRSNNLSININVTSPEAKILVNKFYFPQTLVYKSNTLLQQDKDYYIADSTNLNLEKEQDTSGLILMPLKYGKQTISMKYKETNLRLFADLFSLGALMAALGIIAINVKK